MPVFSKMFNKYWDKDIQVDVVSHKKIEIEEKNFTCFQYEEDNFSKCMLEHMSKLNSEHVVMITEEMVLVDFVDQDAFKKAYKIIEDSDKVKKIMLYRFLDNFYRIGVDADCYKQDLSYYDDNFALNRDSLRKVSAAVWKKNVLCEAFQWLIDSGYDPITPHTFEYNIKCPNQYYSLIPYRAMYPCIDYMHRKRGLAVGEHQGLNNGISSQDVKFFKENT
jgi:hypothetical protein